MKNHELLQAIPSLQDYSRNLRIYARIEILERGKQSNTETIVVEDVVMTKKISIFNDCESDDTVPLKP